MRGGWGSVRSSREGSCESTHGSPSLNLFLCKLDAQHYADCGDAREESKSCQIVSARDPSGSKQDVADGQIE